MYKGPRAERGERRKERNQNSKITIDQSMIALEVYEQLIQFMIICINNAKMWGFFFTESQLYGYSTIGNI